MGADGLMVDVHPDPGSALVDGAQALVPVDFAHLMNDLRAMASALGSASRSSNSRAPSASASARTQRPSAKNGWLSVANSLPLMLTKRSANGRTMRRTTRAGASV